MKVARSLFSGLLLSIFVSACAQGASGNRTPKEPYLFSSTEPSRESSVAPTEQVNHDAGGWSNIWTAQAKLADRGTAAR